MVNNISPVKLSNYSQNLPLIATQLKPVGIYSVESPKSDIKNVRKYFEWNYIFLPLSFCDFVVICEKMDIHRWL